MAEPTLVDVFGASATQNGTTLTITKADLTGLTASSSNSAESLLAAIILTAKTYLTQTAFDANTDQNIYIDNGFSSFTTRGEDAYRVDQLTVNLAKLDTGATLDPDDY